MKKWFQKTAIALLFFTALPGCKPEPATIDYGHDECVNCRMKIMDNRFGTEVVTQKGKTYKFDSIECMVSYDLKEEIAPAEIHSRWVTPFNKPGQLMEAGRALYLYSETLRSPMGMNLSAFESNEAAQQARQEYGGEIITLEQVHQLVKDAKANRMKGSL